MRGEMQYRTWPLELRAIGEPEGRFDGYASVFANKDSYGTIFDSGSFKKSLGERKGKFPITWFHDPMQPIGLASVTEDAHGLLVSGDIDLENDVARRIYSGLRFGYISDMSHGFHAIRHKVDEDGVTHFTEVRLIEVALLTSHYAANPQAVVIAVRNASLGLARIRELEKIGAKSELARVAKDIVQILDGLDLRGATTFSDLPIADRDRAWDAPAAIQRIRRWAGADEEPNEKYRKGFLWFDSGAADLFGSYKLPFADAIDGTLTCIPRAIFAATARLDQTDIPGEDADSVKRHVSRYYAKMRREWDDDELYPPWERSSGIEIALRDLNETIGALREMLAPGVPTQALPAPPALSGEPDFHSLLENLREYSQSLAGRR